MLSGTSESTLNNVLASRYDSQGKFGKINTLIWFCYMKMKKKEQQGAEAPHWSEPQKTLSLVRLYCGFTMLCSRLTNVVRQ